MAGRGSTEGHRPAPTQQQRLSMMVQVLKVVMTMMTRLLSRRLLRLLLELALLELLKLLLLLPPLLLLLLLLPLLKLKGLRFALSQGQPDGSPPPARRGMPATAGRAAARCWSRGGHRLQLRVRARWRVQPHTRWISAR